MKIRTFVDFFHGSGYGGKSRKFEAGQIYDMPDSDAFIIINAGWASRTDNDSTLATPRMIVEPVEVTFNPPK